MEINENVEYKCGICNQQINQHFENLIKHECFRHFNKENNSFVMDEQFYIYIEVKENATQVMQSGSSDSEVTENVTEESDSLNNSNLGKLKWTHESILSLIDIYKQHLPDFFSTKEKNDKVWGRVALAQCANGFHYTAQQCKFKFKYLKSKYMQKKDNMKNTSSGQAAIKFRYFEAMDEIFGKKPNVRPVNLASNLVSRNIIAADDIDQAAVANVPGNILIEDKIVANQEHSPIIRKANKSASTSVDRLVAEIRKNSDVREEARQQRHQENMEFKNQFLNVFNIKMDALINNLNKN